MILPSSVFPAFTYSAVSSGGGAMPSYVGKTAFTGGNGTQITVDFTSTGRVSGDLLLVCVHTAARGVTPPAGWTSAPSSPQSTGSPGTNNAVRLSVFYKISDGTETTTGQFTIGASDVICGIGVVYTGVNNSSPFNIDAGSVLATPTSSVVFDSVTTTVGNCLILNLFGNDRDAAATGSLTAITNANLSSITVRHDQTIPASSGGGIAIIDGGLATAGSSGATTATNNGNWTGACITLALAPT